MKHLYVRIRANVPMGELWCSEEDELSQDQIKELIEEDYLSFIECVGLLDHCEFYWSDEAPPAPRRGE